MTKSRTTLFRLVGDAAFCAQPKYAGQKWARASFLAPFFCPKPLQAKIHAKLKFARVFWPLWVCYAPSGERLGVLWAWGEKLIEKEIELVSKANRKERQ